MKQIIRLFILIAALVLGTDHAWANAESNPRVKFVYVDGNGSALSNAPGFAVASDADESRLVTITVSIIENQDYRCIDGDLTAEVSSSSNMAEAPRRSPGVGQPVAVTCTATNKFTLTLPEDESMNVTVYVSFRAKAPLTVTANDHTINYGEAPANNDVTYYGFEGADDASVLSGTLSFGYTYNQFDPVGTYSITPYGLTSDNYAITFVPGTLTVNPKSITIASVNVENKEYDGTTAATLSGTFSFNDGMIVGSDDVSISFNGASAVFDNKDAGNGKEVTVTGLALTGEKKDNYDLTNPDFTTTGDITKKDLTVTANDWTIDYGEEPANDDVEYDGFVNGEDENTSNIFGESTLTYAYNKQADGLGAPYTTSSPVDKYYIIPSGLTSNNYNIIFQLGTLTVNQKATISVDWDDNNNVGDLRPESLTFKLLANGVETERTVTLNESNNWTATVNGLTPYIGETLIQYTWSLVNDISDNYELGNDTQNTTDTGATATFTFTRKTGSLTVRNTVVSNLAADADEEFTYTVKLTPANITGTYGDMEFTDGEATVTLNAGESATATGLMYGTTYTVTQTEVEGFTTSPDFTATGTISASSTEAPFTNTRETGSLKVTNTVYSSDNDTDFEFTVALTNAPITGTYGDMMFENGVATVTLKGGGSAEATGLPTTVEYTVTQTANDDFSTTKTGDTGTISATLSEAAFKNIMLTEANFEIVWRDGGNTSSRPTEGLTTALLSKLATDGGDPLPVEGQDKTLNEGNNWNATVTNLPVYNEDGYEIAYSWRKIESVPSGYLLTDHSTGIDASYTYTLTTSATVKIEWDDADDQDGIRPTEMTATLSDGSEYNNTVTLNSENNWTYTVVDLPKYKVDDSEITYTWTQDGTLPEGYASTNPSIDGIVTTITNSHTPEVTEVKVSKVWDDDDNEEGFRTESVTVHLMKGEDVIQTAVLNANSDPDHNWTHTWSGLAKNDNGTAINYTVTEDEVEHYTTQITKADGSFTYTVRNSRTVEKTQVSVEALWGDTDNAEGFRPDNITVKLMANGEQAGTVTLNEDNEWKFTFTGLNKYEDGAEIDYTVEQTQLANYKVPVITKTSQTEWAYTVTNSRDYEETNANVTVVWDDSDNEEGFRPTSVIVHLKKGNEVIESVELDADNEWTYTWTQLQMYENATAINYTVTEDEVANYTTQITKATDGTFTYTVTNRRTVEKTEVNVSMVWDDNNDNDRKRPSSVTVKLLANGNEANTATLNEDNEWKYTWTELNKYAGGAEITYTISQEQLDNYKVPVIKKVSETEWEYTVTNNHDLEKTEAMVKVVWVDGNNELHNRPESVTATLLADGTATENTVTMNAENNWTATLTGLQKYSNGEEVDYTWLQGTLPEGYMQTNSAVAEAVTTFTDSYYPDVTVTITGHNNETTYDGTEHIVSGYEAVSSYSLYTDADFIFSGTASASRTDAGTTYMGLVASQFVNDNANYDGKVTFVIAENGDGYQTITPAPVTVKADDKSKEWGTADDPTLTATVTGMVNDEDASTLIAYTIDRATGTITDGVENSGEYTITPTGDATQGNYAVTYETGKFTIEGKPVTIQDVQGNDVSSVDDAYTITQDQNGVTLTLVVPDEMTTPQSVDIPVAVEVNHVVIDRLFESGKAATVYLPFSIEVSKMDGGTFHTFLSVDETTTPLWTVTYSAPLTADAVLQAGTPYIFMPDGSNGGKIVVDNGNDKISICTADQHTDKQGQWEFIGTYDPIVWLSDPTATGYTAERAAEIGLVYGFAAEEKTLDGKDYAVGQFVKVGSGASIDPNRAYLKRIAAQQAPALGEGSQTGMEMPSAMRVVILNADGETGISTWNVERRTWNDDSWYTIDGRKLSGKPSQRGIYINEGRQVVIK